MVLKNVFRSTALGLQTWSVFSGARQSSIALPAFRQSKCSSFSNWTLTRNCKGDETLPNQPVRQYARPSRKKQEFPSQLQDLHPSMLKHEYASVPLAQSSLLDIFIFQNSRRSNLSRLTFESEKMRLKEEQLIAKVQRDENDRSSTEVKVAIMTARIRNIQEHLHKHPKDKANKRLMLMTIDSRKKKLKFLRRTRYDSFTKVCQELGITYTFPPEYYRRVTRRWLAKKAFCNKVFKEVQKQKAEQREKQRATEAKEKEPTSSTEPQGTAL
ncbi:hypothetical protein ABG768_008728 [Culter alburnus]|uniref:Small ribosomal subunit protein uS15m n=1 Tax=Culter alburnus TaxID=194366 RepID=A0AAW1ZLG6_CULAL